MKSNRLFSVFQIALLALPAFFLLYLWKTWFWFLVPLPTNGLEYATGFLLLWYVLGLMFFDFPRPRMSSRWQWIAVILFLVAATVATAETVLHLEKGRAVPLGIWKGWFMAPATYFFLLIASFRSRDELKKLIDVTIGIIAFTAGAMLLQYFSGIFSEVTATYDLRLVWPYLDPLSGLGTSGNYPALFISPFLAMAWIMLMRSQKGLDRWYYAIGILMMLATVYFTQSYGAWMAVIGACAVASFFRTHGKTRWVIVPFMTLLLLGGLYLDQKNSEKFQFAVDTTQENVIGSGEERLNIWAVSWDLIERDPLWGVGPGQFQRAFERQAPFTLNRDVSRQEINHALHTHNTFLMFWLSNGIFGVLTFLLLFGVLIWSIPREWRWVLLTPLLYYLLHGLIDVFYWKNDLAYSFWFFAGLIVIAQNLNTVSGKVEHGIKMGRELGFPTANIQLDLKLNKDYGVYAVILRIEKEKKMGLLYYGPRMTKGLPENMVCEVTVLDFEGDLYDKKISFKIGKFIRGPMKFDSPEELKKQIQKDILVARNKRFKISA
ncbi:MAG: riboflavin kinase [bacterium]|nr:riboflavin kinase [bacterium]